MVPITAQESDKKPHKFLLWQRCPNSLECNPFSIGQYLNIKFVGV